MRKLSLCLFLTGILFIASAQETTKLDLRLYLKLKSGQLNGTNIALMVQGDLSKIQRLTKEVGGQYKMGHGDIASVSIPAEKIFEFENNTAIKKIENTGSRGIFLMDTSRIRNNVDSVHQGFAPLVTAYKGKGVIIGIIDGGIYWQHGDFRNPADSSTRIRYIWDQVASGSNAPAPYAYGNQWTWFDINNGNCTHVPPNNDFGHGTCVAGIAAGNSLSTKGTDYEGMMTGIAPESEIIAVRIKTDENFLSNVADAVDYIFKKADALGKPCVINTSIGTYYGSHDGKDLTTQLIEYLLDERKGRIVVAAGGNGGEIPHHLSYPIPVDSAYTFFKVNPNYDSVYLDFWADTANFNGAYFAIGCNDAMGTDMGRTPYYNVRTNFNPAQGSSFIIGRDLSDNSNNLLGKILMQATLHDSRYHVEVLVYSISDFNNLWRLQTQGTGRFDLWASSNPLLDLGTSDMTSYISIGGGQEAYIQYPNYRHPDSLKTIVSSWQCSDKIITVGNYSSRAGYLDRDSAYQDLTVSPYFEVVGHQARTSSNGPTRDGRLKPDVMATGNTTICTGDGNFIALAISPSNRLKVSITKKHIRNGGTSMASPVVSGIAAMYLQKRPSASYSEIKKVLIWTAVRDSFTGPNANYNYGNGKVNAFQALTYAGIVYGTNDTACINYNAQANIDTGGCVAKVYGSMDTACLNYMPQANVSGGSCVVKTYGCTDPSATNYMASANVDNGTCAYPNVSVNDVAADNILKVVPNPFSGQTTFVLPDGFSGNASIRIYNAMGMLVDEINMNTPQYIYRNSQLPAGIYFYRLLRNQTGIATGKLVVE